MNFKLPSWLIYRLRAFAYQILLWAHSHCRHDSFEWDEGIDAYCCTGCGGLLRGEEIV